MLTRAEHAKLTGLLNTFRECAVGVERALEVGSKQQENFARQKRSAAYDALELYINELGPSPFEHPMLAKQQNDGLREKQGR